MGKLILASCMVLAASAAGAQEYPAREIRSICNFAAGSGADIIVRYYSDQLSRLAGKPVIVENKPGAQGSIASAFVAKSAPDGYTIHITPASSTLASAPHIWKQLPFDPLKDFATVTTINSLSFVVAVDSSKPIHKMSDLIAVLKAKTGHGFYGTQSNSGQISAELIKANLNINVCTSLGLLSEGQAEQLAAAGVTRFNHNLESSREHFPEVCTTHSYDDRIRTVRAAKAAGMEACCGGIMGMGETLEDRVALAFEVRELEVESIPVNFLDPRPGTPLAHQTRLTPPDCLRALAMFRFVNPSRDIRMAGGRETNLRQLQALALYPANSLFCNGYLTTPGQGAEADIRMITDAGFRVAELVPAI